MRVCNNSPLKPHPSIRFATQDAIPIPVACSELDEGSKGMVGLFPPRVLAMVGRRMAMKEDAEALKRKLAQKERELEITRDKKVAESREALTNRQ